MFFVYCTLSANHWPYPILQNDIDAGFVNLYTLYKLSQNITFYDRITSSLLIKLQSQTQPFLNKLIQEKVTLPGYKRLLRIM